MEHVPSHGLLENCGGPSNGWAEPRGQGQCVERQRGGRKHSATRLIVRSSEKGSFACACAMFENSSSNNNNNLTKSGKGESSLDDQSKTF